MVLHLKRYIFIEITQEKLWRQRQSEYYDADKEK